MTMRSIKWAGAVSIAAMLMLGTSLPAAAQGQVQAVPRVGLTFPSTVTARVTIESVDSDTRTVAFFAPDGRLLDVAVSDAVKNLDAIEHGSPADVTYTQVVTILNLRQKGPGSKLARSESMNANAPDNAAGRFTLTITAIDLNKNTVSVIHGVGGEIQT